jgi:hypothetical protein
MKLKLRGPVRRNASVDPTDSLLAKSSLHLLGKYTPPDDGITPWPDEAMFRAIKEVQVEHGLEADEVMLPDGPTIKK